MGHGHSFSLLQVVVPVEVTHILSRVSIWNAHRQKTLSLSNLLSNILSYSFHAAVHRVVLTRLQWLLTHAGAPSRPRQGALRRNRGGLLLSSESKWMSTGPKLWWHREEHIKMKLLHWATLLTSVDIIIYQWSLCSLLFSTTTRLMRQVIPLACNSPLSTLQAKVYQWEVTGNHSQDFSCCLDMVHQDTWHLSAKKCY